MANLIHTGPDYANKILDSWCLNDYIVALYLNPLDAVLVKILRVADILDVPKSTVHTYYTSNRLSNVLRMLNVCLQAVDQNCIAALPVQQGADKLRWENDPDFLLAIQPFNRNYITELNEDVLIASVSAIREVHSKEAGKIKPGTYNGAPDSCDQLPASKKKIANLRNKLFPGSDM